MTFIDSNIPMYLVGAAHPNRDRAASLLRSLVARRERLVTSAEVFQEILHRYHAIGRLAAAADAFALLGRLADEVLAIERTDVDAALDILTEHTPISARDALHLAVMRRHDIDRIMSFDTGFDDLPGVVRLA